MGTGSHTHLLTRELTRAPTGMSHAWTHAHTCTRSHAHGRMRRTSSRTCARAHASTRVMAHARSGTTAAAATSGAEEPRCFSPNTCSHSEGNRKGLGAGNGKGRRPLAGSRLRRGARWRPFGADTGTGTRTAAGERRRVPTASGPRAHPQPRLWKAVPSATWWPGPSRLRAPGLRAGKGAVLAGELPASREAVPPHLTSLRLVGLLAPASAPSSRKPPLDASSSTSGDLLSPGPPPAPAPATLPELPHLFPRHLLALFLECPLFP